MKLDSTPTIKELQELRETFAKMYHPLAVEIIDFIIKEFDRERIEKGDILRYILDDISKNPISTMLVTSKAVDDFYIKNYKNIGITLNDMQDNTGEIVSLNKPLDYHNFLINRAVSYEAWEIMNYLENLEENEPG